MGLGTCDNLSMCCTSCIGFIEPHLIKRSIGVFCVVSMALGKSILMNFDSGVLPGSVLDPLLFSKYQLFFFNSRVSDSALCADSAMLGLIECQRNREAATLLSDLKKM